MCGAIGGGEWCAAQPSNKTGRKPHMGAVRPYGETAAIGSADLQWQIVETDLPGVGFVRYEEPAADFTTVGGEVSLRVDKFERGDGRLQLFDNPKHLMISTRSFELPPDSVTSFSVEMAAENIGGDPDDYRSGFVAFNVVDLETAWVWDHALTSRRAWAVHERLQIPGVVPVEESMYRVVEDTYHMPEIDGEQFHDFRIELDTRAHQSRWFIDDRKIHEAASPVFPARVNVGIGLVTLFQIRNGESRSIRGQGMAARYRNFRVPA
jgi:hypothetical protein